MEASFERNNRLIAMGITTLVAALLMIIILLIKFITPIPPFEESQMGGLEVNFGFEEAGMGDNNTLDPVTSDQKKTEASSEPESSTASEMLASEEVSEVVTPPVKTKIPEVIVEQPKPDQNLLDALNKKHTTASSNAGDGNTNTPGNQGDPNGTLNSNVYSEGSTGDGVNWKLKGKGRIMIGKIEIYDDSQETGIVAVEYIVDKYGKVIKAEPILMGSTTTSANLWKKAKSGILNSGSLFNQSASGEEARGTIYINFTVR